LRGEDIEERRNAFSARLGALSRAHDMLMAADWSTAQLRDVIASAIEAHRTEGRPIAFNGPAIELSAKQGMSMALATHELATNAAKYGALSVDGGSVEIEWSIHGRDPAGAGIFEFVWREIGGPQVEPPARQGFGSR